MRPDRCFSVWRPAGARPRMLAISGLTFLLALAQTARADVFTLKSGGTVEGEIIKQDEAGYTVKTVIGTVRLARDMVVSVKTAPSPFAEYEQRLAEVRQTAESHYALASWCAKRGLNAKRREHLKRSIELSPDFEPARKALGYVRVGALWVNGKKVARKQTGKSAEPKNETAAPPNDDTLDDQTLVKSIQTGWMRRIRAIKQTYLLSKSLPQMIKQGRDRILAIEDPLAILPLTRNFGKGTLMQRRLLVEALSKFEQDESTMNLAVMALVDRNAKIRRAVISQLIRRKDERVPAQFRKALGSKNEELVQRAAFALASLDRKEAIPELIEALTGRARMRVYVPVRRYFGEFTEVFAGNSRIQIGERRSVRIKPQIGVVDSRGVVQVEVEQRVHDVTVYRTEVLEALKRLTGQNFGFEHDQWRLWYQENMQ